MQDQTQLIQVHPQDNVAVATMDLDAGTHNENLGLTLTDAVPAGHKVSLKAMHAGDNIMKYGFPIGHLLQDVAAGAHIHSHNLKTNLSGQEAYTWKTPAKNATGSKPSGATFMGYRRENGKVGIRNEIWIINTVGCVNRTAERIASECERRFTNECDGFRAFTHPFGCSQLGDDLTDTLSLIHI